MPQNIESSAILDCQNLNCPEPVIQCKKFCQNNKDILCFTVLVNNAASKENVTRFLKTQNYDLKITIENTTWYIQACKKGQEQPKSNQANTDILTENQAEKKHLDFIREKTVVLLSSEFFGSGDEILGSKLMLNFLNTLPELKDELWRIIMLNSAVKLSSKNHQAVGALKKLEDFGVEILVCGTCLEFYNILKDKQVGETTNMLDVVTSLQLADKLIQI
ncbi:sulfurtransferase-like selenium metabolism protein YedF [Desulfovibrio litoralis]|uniref:Selenium metabolism protein YedF n=1 Tax=Desulfovibrio litoralis DSM 11393 TaxID=1121455 RepID=A0A1M7SXB7_9BACT|nr:sulfurtransferase-like selenium metabolism protein YedF [Desulfovibrio litoralis]SHN63100.1 selenium metabolism protein YedF [Desulfovibrio litoralis DSM 11393]